MQVLIVLSGFMGSGKNAVGRRLSKKYGFGFIDMDSYIESKEAMKIIDIFKNKGEDYFRACETETCSELADKDDTVICTGGGTLMNEKNVEILKEAGAVIYFLEVPIEALQERLKNDKKRPLLQRENRHEYIDELYRKRYPQYMASADVVIPSGAPACVVAERVEEDIDRRLKSVK
jgi:shikimate kinase